MHKNYLTIHLRFQSLNPTVSLFCITCLLIADGPVDYNNVRGTSTPSSRRGHQNLPSKVINGYSSSSLSSNYNKSPVGSSTWGTSNHRGHLPHPQDSSHSSTHHQQTGFSNVVANDPFEFFDAQAYLQGDKVQRGQDAYGKTKFNQIASDNLPIDRSIPDTRHPM